MAFSAFTSLDVLRKSRIRQVRQHLVFIWAVATPYRHSDGNRELSRVVYIEKTAGTIFGRWTRRYIHLLADGADAEEPRTGTDLRWLASQASNGLFYRTLIAAFGPLQVWWAEVDRLNKASKESITDARKWERLILTGYRKQHGCLPLKNRRG